jgi:hypothetical protein
LSWSTISMAVSRALGLRAPSGELTATMSGMPPCPNLSTSNWLACADSESGSRNPPADRLFATGSPKMAAATKTMPLTARTRRGAAMAINAIRVSTILLADRDRKLTRTLAAKLARRA